MEEEELRVLVVEDDPDFSTILAETLAEAGYHAERASTIGEAKTLLSRYYFVLAVIDINLNLADPANQDGFGVIQSIKRDDQQLPVLVVSATLNVDRTRRLLREFDAKNIIEKDLFDIDDFKTQVRQYVRPVDPQHEYFLGHGLTPQEIENLRGCITAVLGEIGLRVRAADKHVGQGYILDKVKGLIERTRFAIFDLHDLRPNVLLEVGIAIGLNRPFMLTAPSDCRVPDILDGFPTITYSSFRDLRDKLRQQAATGWVRRVLDERPRGTFCRNDERECDDGLGKLSCIYLLVDTPDPRQQDRTQDDFREAVQDALAGAGYSPIYGDVAPESEFRLCQHCRQVRSAPLSIFRVWPGASPEVYVLFGLAVGLNRRFVMITDKNPTLPSDLNGLSRFEYLAYGYLRNNLAAEISEHLEERCRGGRGAGPA